MNYYTIFPLSQSYDKGARKKLIKQLKRDGFIYQRGQFGGGPSEIKEIIVGWLSIHPLWTGVLIGILANRIDGLLIYLFNWHKRNKKENKAFIPIINIVVYPSKINKKSFRIGFRIDKTHTKTEIIKKIKKSLVIKQKEVENWITSSLS